MWRGRSGSAERAAIGAPDEDARRQAESLEQTDHRPWALPRAPWLMGQTWRHLTFAHWRIDASRLRGCVPRPLTLDEHDGSAWIGVSPFIVQGLHPRGVPPIPGASSFRELNVRTYVTLHERPGILFLTLDASSRVAVVSARLGYRLPYRSAVVEVENDDGRIESRSRRAGLSTRFRVRPVGDASGARPGSLDAFLIERYCLYAAGRHVLLRADIHHRPWQLHAADEDAVVEVAGDGPLSQLGGAPLLHIAPRQDVVIWGPRPVAWL